MSISGPKLVKSSYLRNIMAYKYRVTLAGIKGFFRLYLVNPKNTLYSLHKQLRADLEFTVDQPILFKAFDAEGNVVGRYALIDLGSGSVDNVTIADTVKAGAVSFQYFYDIKGKKSVIVTLEEEDRASNVQTPRCIETKGPVPAEFENGYVAFEDIPKEPRKHSPIPDADDIVDGDKEDEDDEDDEDESEDREEEEIIYDENE